jgi:tetratricopeptide (TPR) repeat protein
VLLLLAVATSGAKQKTAADTKPSDYSKEAYVSEQIDYQLVFENDGTSTLEASARVRVQSQAGVQSLGLLNFPYASSSSTLDVLYVRVTKPDKRVITTPAENVLEMPTQITQEAPFYSDQKQKQVAVKGLEIGDVLEYSYRVITKTPLAPGQFWFAFNFARKTICLQEQLQISVPRDRAVKVESTEVQPITTEQGAYRVYLWKTSNLQTEAEKKAAKIPEPDEPQKPAVQLSSFQDWDQVGQWFRGLMASRAAVTPQIQAKAAEITKNAKTDQEKTQALYDYVSTKFRYIGIALGIGRYQPHAAEDVLSNDYGDCKDKHTLLAALLAAENIKAYPALISVTAKVDAGMPSPGQFDHVITALPQPGGGFLFLDTTPEVAPFSYLIFELRDKEALVIPDSGPSQLVRTPKDPPFKPKFDFTTDGKLDDDGTLISKSRILVRNDAEVAYRDAFRRGGEPHWNEVMQQISSLLGFGGTVSDVTISPPDATSAPFQLDYTYTRKTYGDWDDRQIVSPFPFVFLPPVPEEDAPKSKPIKLGVPSEYVFHGTMALPPDSDPALHSTVDFHEDFADYHSSYTEENGVLTFERRVVTKADEVSVAQLPAYKKFVKEISDDQGRYIPLSAEGAASPQPSFSPEPSVDPAARPDFQQALDAMKAGDSTAAAAAFRRSIAKAPNFSEAWFMLGQVQLQQGKIDPGLESIRKAISLRPQQVLYYQELAQTLTRLHRDREARQVLAALAKVSASGPEGALTLADAFASANRYGEVIAVLEPALKKNPDNAKLQLALGEAYLRDYRNEQAIPLLHSAAAHLETKEDAESLLADNDVDLQASLQSSRKAVAFLESQTMETKLDELQETDPRNVTHLAAAWDELGLISFRMGKLDDAEKYLSAAWSLTQNADTADRLGQVYEKLGKKHEAAVAYSHALDTDTPPSGTRQRLQALGPPEKPAANSSAANPSAKSVIVAADASLQDLRTVKISKFPDKPAQHASADFFLLFASGALMPQVKFVNGSELLRNAGPTLASAKIEAVFPDANPTQIFRRGILDCEPELTGCIFVLYPPDQVGIGN